MAIGPSYCSEIDFNAFALCSMDNAFMINVIGAGILMLDSLPRFGMMKLLVKAIASTKLVARALQLITPAHQ